MSRAKEFIKSRPRLYDIANSLRPIRSPTEAWVDRFSKDMGPGLTFVQVGANDGLRWDPFRRFVMRDHWTGVLVEPLPGVFEMLRRNYHRAGRRLKFLNALVGGGARTEAELWTVSKDFLSTLPLDGQLFWLRKASLSRERMLETLKNNGADREFIVGETVQCVSLTWIIENYCAQRAPDLIVSDAEGFDDEVLYSLDLERYKPRALLFEAHALGNRLAPLLAHLDGFEYRVRMLDGDAVAVAGDWAGQVPG